MVVYAEMEVHTAIAEVRSPKTYIVAGRSSAIVEELKWAAVADAVADAVAVAVGPVQGQKTKK